MDRSGINQPALRVKHDMTYYNAAAEATYEIMVIKT